MRPIKVFITDDGCHIDLNHKVNQDGYLRLNRGSKPYMQYIKVWEQANGPKSDGFEIHHRCKNRACFNLEHLECIPGDEHVRITNRERKEKRWLEAYSYWKETKCNFRTLNEQFPTIGWTLYSWIRLWKRMDGNLAI